MSVTDTIVEDIVKMCEQEQVKEFSRIVIREDYIEGFADMLADEIVEKLKAKGITVGT